MKGLQDHQLVALIGGVLGLLVVASAAGAVLSRRVRSDAGRATVANLNARIRAWWAMVAVFTAAVWIGPTGSIVLFALISFLALREFVTLAPTRREDHGTLFWSFFLITPLQYVLIGVRWYGLFSIMIPVYAFAFVAVSNVLAGGTERFLERTATIHWGLMVCVYCVSYAPALLVLEIPGFGSRNTRLLVFLVLVVELSDVFQYTCGKLWGRRPIAPSISPNKTWEGFVGGILAASAVGTAIWWATPFSVWEAGLMSLAITLAGFAGGLILSAIKRDRGVKDYGSFIQGHGGMLDRIDSLCFAAPIFFHLTRYFFTP
ncbi:MAG TPA: phosphatidate cytidylyltransferase [Thermoanaerobaculia bacterium]|nr:phosphatidate cytidylyltransferase [Thermoanaerobaculia bacterium]